MKNCTCSWSEYRQRRVQIDQTISLIIESGRPEMHEDSRPYCSHLKRRKGYVGCEDAEAQVFHHAAGTVIRFWVYGSDYSLKVRELLVLPAEGKGWEMWLRTSDNLFPHEGKYALAALKIIAHLMAGN